ALTSGVTTRQDSALLGNSTDKSILGTVAVAMGDSANLSLAGGDFLSRWCIGCLVKHSGNPAGARAIWALGDAAGARKNVFLYIDPTLLRVQSVGWANYDMVLHSTSGLTDGNWHLVLINYDQDQSPSTDRLMFSIDGSAFTSPIGGNFLALTSVNTTFTLLTNGGGAFSGDGVGLDEVFVVAENLTDAQALLIHSIALKDMRSRRNLWTQRSHWQNRA
ncbi:hypothetical protein LCGC14_1897500, partial [marine sediment metagenome]